MKPDKPIPLNYYGGKARGGIADWIISLLPPADYKRQLYVEPYGGMASVMLARAPVKTEILNDLNSRLVNWWQVVQSAPNDLGWMVETTPRSREIFTNAIALLDDPDVAPLQRAWAFHVVLTQSIHQGDNDVRPGQWGIHYNPSVGGLKQWTTRHILPLAKRMIGVQIENRPAVELLRRIADCEYAVIYADPPYPSADTRAYLHSDVDIAELTDALLAQRGFVAVSGYGDEWEHLGWERHEQASYRNQIAARNLAEARTEVLWTNRLPPQRLL